MFSFLKSLHPRFQFRLGTHRPRDSDRKHDSGARSRNRRRVCVPSSRLRSISVLSEFSAGGLVGPETRVNHVTFYTLLPVGYLPLSVH